MIRFKLPGASAPSQPTFSKGEKRKLLAMGVGVLLMIGAYLYSRASSPGTADPGLPLEATPEISDTIVLPELDPAAIDALVNDEDTLHRVELEGPGVDALLFDARTLTARHYQELETPFLDSEKVAALLANPASQRAQPFSMRGHVDHIRERAGSSVGETEYIGRMQLESGETAYFLVLDYPELASFVRVDGLFLKIYSEESREVSGQWLDGPLLVGAKAIRSYPALGTVTQPNYLLYGQVEDCNLSLDPPHIVGQPDFDAWWHMMAYARDLPEGSVDWESAPRLDREQMNAMLADPASWRGKPVVFPKLRILDGRVVSAGENPARIERYTTGWGGSWNWPAPIRFHFPDGTQPVGRHDMADARGFFLQIHSYNSKGHALSAAPIFVLQELSYWEPVTDPIFTNLGYVMIGLAVVLGLGFLLLLRRDKARSRRLQEDLIRRRRARRSPAKSTP